MYFHFSQLLYLRLRAHLSALCYCFSDGQPFGHGLGLAHLHLDFESWMTKFSKFDWNRLAVSSRTVFYATKWRGGRPGPGEGGRPNYLGLDRLPR